VGFFEQLKGYDNDIVLHSQEEDSVTTIVRGLAIYLSPEAISRVTTLPLGI